MKERTTSLPFQSFVSVALVMLAASTSTASAERASVIITGKASERDRSVVAGAVSEAVSKASWSVDGNAFKPDEMNSIVKCLQNDRPWSCIEPTVRSRQLGNAERVGTPVCHERWIARVSS